MTVRVLLIGRGDEVQEDDLWRPANASAFRQWLPRSRVRPEPEEGVEIARPLARLLAEFDR